MTNELPCWCEAIAAYGLGALEEPERRWVEQQAADPELEAELAELQGVAMAIAYAAPVVEPAPQLQGRLFERLGLEPVVSEPVVPVAAMVETTEQASVPDLLQQLETLRWQAYKVPGIEVVRLHVDRRQREASLLLRARAGATYPRHHHAGPEEILMLQGDLRIGERLLLAGDYVRSLPESEHEVAVTQGGCLFFLRTSIDNEILS